MLGSPADFAKPKRKPDTGRVRPYRRCPHDFRDRFVELGWSEIEDHYRANSRVIARFIDEVGRDELVEDRAEFVALRRHRQNMKRFQYRTEIANGTRASPLSLAERRVIDHCIAVGASEAAARAWLKQPLGGYGGETPLRLIAHGRGYLVLKVADGSADTFTSR